MGNQRYYLVDPYKFAFCMEKTLIFSLFSKCTEEQRCFPKVCLMHCPQSRWSKDAIVITEKSGMKNKAREPNNKLDTMWSERCQKQSWEFLPFWVQRELRVGFECQDLWYNFGSWSHEVKWESSGSFGSCGRGTHQEPVPNQGNVLTVYRVQKSTRPGIYFSLH